MCAMCEIKEEDQVRTHSRTSQAYKAKRNEEPKIVYYITIIIVFL